MENTIDNKTDVIINHRMGCQVFWILFCIFMIAVGIIYILFVKEAKWYNHVFAALFIISGFYIAYKCVATIIKERLNKIPALIVTSKSLIVSGNKKEYNEIPFDVVEKFMQQRVRTGHNRYTYYLLINYKPDDGSSKKFTPVDKIDCGGLNMRHDKLLKLLQERLAAYNA